MKGINALAPHESFEFIKIFAILVSIFCVEVYIVAQGAFWSLGCQSKQLFLTNTLREHYSCRLFVLTKWGFGVHLLLRQITQTQPKLTKVRSHFGSRHRRSERLAVCAKSTPEGGLLLRFGWSVLCPVCRYVCRPASLGLQVDAPRAWA